MKVFPVNGHFIFQPWPSNAIICFIWYNCIVRVSELKTPKVFLIHQQTICDYCKAIVSFLAVYIDENKTEVSACQWMQCLYIEYHRVQSLFNGCVHINLSIMLGYSCIMSVYLVSCVVYIVISKNKMAFWFSVYVNQIRYAGIYSDTHI